ncbi:hypothetical protein GE09DRAFT_355546 [Coniochaeta sp. 2T2.1]|nr:hypothetical protein GE09DRAFT_355546 [Coniochaeta sp. 2T2.1]
MQTQGKKRTEALLNCRAATKPAYERTGSDRQALEKELACLDQKLAQLSTHLLKDPCEEKSARFQAHNKAEFVTLKHNREDITIKLNRITAEEKALLDKKLAEQAKRAEEARLAEHVRLADEKPRFQKNLPPKTEAPKHTDGMESNTVMQAWQKVWADKKALADPDRAEAAAVAQQAQLVHEQELAKKQEQAEQSRKLTEASRLAEQAKQLEAIRQAEEARLAEEAQAATERKLREQKRAEEARLAQEARQAEDARQAQVARQFEEARQAQEARQAREARQAEEARQAQEARHAETARATQVDEARHQEEKAAILRRFFEEQRKRDEENRAVEEARFAEGLETFKKKLEKLHAGQKEQLQKEDEELAAAEKKLFESRRLEEERKATVLAEKIAAEQNKILSDQEVAAKKKETIQEFKAAVEKRAAEARRIRALALASTPEDEANVKAAAKEQRRKWAAQFPTNSHRAPGPVARPAAVKAVPASVKSETDVADMPTTPRKKMAENVKPTPSKGEPGALGTSQKTRVTGSFGAALQETNPDKVKALPVKAEPDVPSSLRKEPVEEANTPSENAIATQSKKPIDEAALLVRVAAIVAARRELATPRARATPTSLDDAADSDMPQGEFVQPINEVSGNKGDDSGDDEEDLISF